MNYRDNKLIKTAHIIHSLSRGGIETWLKYLLDVYDPNEVELEIITIASEPAEYDTDFADRGIRIHRLATPLNFFKFLFRYRKILSVGQYDAVHSHLYLFNGITLPIAWLSRVPVRIAHIYPPSDPLRQSLVRRVYSYLMWNLIKVTSTSVVACSKMSLDHVIAKIGPHQPQKKVVYCGIPLQQFRSPRNKPARSKELAGKFVIGYVARFWPHKHHQFVIHLADHYRESQPDFHFLVCGAHGAKSDEILEQASERVNVTCIIDPEDVAVLYQQMDLFVFPSTHEGFGIVAVEAAAAGLPVIATRHPAIMEAVCPELRPAAFEPLNLQQAINSIDHISQNPAEYARLVAASRTWADRFSAENSWMSLKDIYCQQLSEKRSQHDATDN